jgi:hypothetical protein
MLDQLVATVSQKTGLPPDQARAAVDAVVAHLRAHLPAPLAAHLDGLLAGATPTGASPSLGGGLLGDLESRAGDMLGGLMK